MIVLLHVVVLCFLQVFRSSNFAYNYRSVFGCIPSESRYGNVPNELIHRAGPPFPVNGQVVVYVAKVANSSILMAYLKMLHSYYGCSL